MHRLVWSEHAREPPPRGPCNGGRAEAQGQGALAVRGRDLPLAAGEGGGAHFLHEHPMTAGSWGEDCVKRL
eukprot:8734669-Alexandrium_andersonii.AAC.1